MNLFQELSQQYFDATGEDLPELTMCELIISNIETGESNSFITYTKQHLHHCLKYLTTKGAGIEVEIQIVEVDYAKLPLKTLNEIMDEILFEISGDGVSTTLH